MESFPSLSYRLPPGDYQLTTLQGPWGQERQVVAQDLGDKSVGSSRPGAFDSADVALVQPLRAAQRPAIPGPTGLVRQLEHGVPTALRQGEHGVAKDSPRRTGPPRRLQRTDRHRPGESLELPEVAFTVTRGDLDDAANALHRYQRLFVAARNPANDPPWCSSTPGIPFRAR